MKRLAAIVAVLLMSALPIAAMMTAEQEDDLYQKATKALDAQRWTAAIAALRQIVNDNGPRVDRALYWMAHAQFKSGRGADALSTLQTLRSRFPKSQWIDDAEAMEVEIRESAGQPVSPEAIDDEELKLIAISSLMHTEPTRALALLQKILSQPGSAAMKERALFVLGQLDSAEAQKALEGYARNAQSPELQRLAIRSIAVSGKRNGAVLADIYRHAANAEIKTAVIEALMIVGDRAHLAEIAETDRDPAMRSAAAQKLGMTKGTAELARLYAKETSREVKDAIIQGLFLGGDVDTLSRIARSENDLEMRRHAIRGLGMVSGKRAHDVLIEIWGADSSQEAKEGVIEALFIRGDAKTLIAFAKKETNRELRRQLVQRISLMNTPEAREFMLDILNR